VSTGALRPPENFTPSWNAARRIFKLCSHPPDRERLQLGKPGTAAQSFYENGGFVTLDHPFGNGAPPRGSGGTPFGRRNLEASLSAPSLATCHPAWDGRNAPNLSRARNALHRPLAQEQLRCNLLVAAARGQEPQHLRLPPRQPCWKNGRDLTTIGKLGGQSVRTRQGR
jgi:hypothetical protein